MDIYVARAGDGVLHTSLKPGAPAPDSIGYANDAHAVFWADDIKMLLFTRQNDIGRYNPMATGPANDDHNGEDNGIDIVEGMMHMFGTFGAPKVNAYDPTGAMITFKNGCTPGLTVGQPAGLTTDGANVYWADTTEGYVGKSDYPGNGNVLVSPLNAPTSVAVDGGNLYIAVADAIVQAASGSDAGATKTLASNLTHPFSITFAAGKIYWLDPTGTLSYVAPAGGTPTPLGVGAAITNTTPQRLIVVAGNSVFWGNPQDGTVKQVAKPP